MDKLKLIKIAALAVFLFLVYSLFFDNTCKLSGCKNEGTGWKNSTSLLDKPESSGGCSVLPCRPIGSSGGYCSREHALQDM